MTAQEYAEYRASETWRQKRKERLEIDNFQCQMCGIHLSESPLETHHFRYSTLGVENVWTDIVSVCPSCHLSIHRIMARKTAPNRRGWKPLPAGVEHSLKEHGIA